MKFSVTGIGIWARGVKDQATLQALLADGADPPDSGYEKPKPEAIPARERRRSGELINLAVEVAHQACTAATVDPASVASVFSSALSDTAVTDYMGRKLAETDKLLSPTKFHNSVHNAASGYWSISAGNRAPSTFVSGFRESFGAGLLEAVSLCDDRQEPVLYVAYDMANAAPFNDFAPIDESLATGFVLTPDTGNNKAASFMLRVDKEHRGTDVPRHSFLACLAARNYSGPGLTLAEACLIHRNTLSIAFTPDRSLQLTRLDDE